MKLSSVYIYSASLVIGRFNRRKHQNADLCMSVASRLQEATCHVCNIMLAISHSGLVFLGFENCNKISTHWSETGILKQYHERECCYTTLSVILLLYPFYIFNG